MVPSIQKNQTTINGKQERPQPLRVASHQPVLRYLLDQDQLNKGRQNPKNRSNLRVIKNKTKEGVKIEDFRNITNQFLSQVLSNEEMLSMWQNLLEVQKKLQFKVNQYANDKRLIESSLSQTALTQNPKIENPFLQKLNTHLLPLIHETDLDVARVCSLLKMSKTNLFTKLKAATGLSISLYVRKLKLIKGKEMLLTTSLTVSEIAYQTGFNDPKYFTRVFSSEYGISPKEMRTIQ
ncbi:MAG TPA: helix-turn-helix transcriptional regulator [Saprospiraceae bacterium]|nr:helix-turn-helix transcriptional regulator [Saprospiraceae bacterium]